MFSAEVNLTLLSQLTAKSYDHASGGPSGTAYSSLAFILEDTKVVGMGVCLRAATVLVHKSSIENNRQPVIYLRQHGLKVNTIVKKIENDIALLLVRNNHFY